MRNKLIIFVSLSILHFLFMLTFCFRLQQVNPFLQAVFPSPRALIEKAPMLIQSPKNIKDEKSRGIKGERKTYDVNETNNNVIQNKNCIKIEVRAGVGGKEAVAWSKDLKKAYKTFAERNNWGVIEKNDICNSLIIKSNKNVCLVKDGEKININLFDLFKNESGIHQTKRIPLNESKGRIHSSTAAVAVFLFTEVEHENLSDYEITKNIKIKTFHCSKPGGQNVNKVESGVSITHLPTGIKVESQRERTQELNRKIALQKLKEKLKQIKLAERKEIIQTRRIALIKGRRRSERIRTYNYAKGFIYDYIKNKKIDLTYFLKNKLQFLLNIYI